MDVVKEYFSGEDLEKLLRLTPNRKIEEIEYALNGKGFHEKHLVEFERKTKNGYFSILR